MNVIVNRRKSFNKIKLILHVQVKIKMDLKSRACRVCMQTEGEEKFLKIFDENAEKAVEIFLVAGVQASFQKFVSLPFF